MNKEHLITERMKELGLIGEGFKVQEESLCESCIHDQVCPFQDTIHESTKTKCYIRRVNEDI